uniref:Uncharacterized protein n=1 Tax=Cajanus cajan TaxID=3821 RepID=A0A151QR86_CAJCA|nr:hypothetical protein KK1_046428 [Cajanus cajan]
MVSHGLNSLKSGVALSNQKSSLYQQNNSQNWKHEAKSHGPGFVTSRSGDTRRRGIRHLSAQELFDRKKKGLCFRCGQQYHPMHQWLLTLLAEDEVFNEEGEIVSAKGDNDETLEEVKCTAMCLFHSTKEAVSSPKVMKLKGQLNGLPILILVDSGASHNFVSRRVVKALNLPVQDTSSVSIRLGDGHRVLTKGTCNLKVDLGPMEASVTAYVFGLSGLDLILGIKWLETLGLVQTDSGQMTMTFYNKNELITLCGIKPKVATATSSLHNLIASKRLSFDKLFWNIQV